MAGSRDPARRPAPAPAARTPADDAERAAVVPTTRPASSGSGADDGTRRGGRRRRRSAVRRAPRLVGRRPTTPGHHGLDRFATREAVGRAAGEALALDRARCHEGRRVARTCTSPGRRARGPGAAGRHGSGRTGTGRPRRRGGPVTRRVAARPFLDREIVVGARAGPLLGARAIGATASGRRSDVPCPGVVGSHHGSRRGWLSWGAISARLGRLASGPCLEGRAHRERAREAVRLLVGERAGCRLGLGEAAMAVVRTVRPGFPVVVEGDEGARRGSVQRRLPSFGHRGDDSGRGPLCTGRTGTTAPVAQDP